jgi:hypothetical protein
VKRATVSFVLILGLLIPVANPSNANDAIPPKIVSVEQVTKGPYSIGDIVTLKLTATSDKDVITSWSIFGVRSPEACLLSGAGSIGNLDAHLQYSKFNSVGNSIYDLIHSKVYKSNGTTTMLLTGIVLPCAFTWSDPLITLGDGKGKYFYANEKEQWFYDDVAKTNVVSQGLGDLVSQLKFIIKTSDLFISQGEPKPTKIDDQIDIKNIPKNPKLKKRFVLPKFTSGGAPIFWEAKSTVCEVEKKPFAGSLGVTLKIKGLGTCKLNNQVMVTDKFNLPSINANFEFKKQGDNGPFTALLNTRK